MRSKFSNYGLIQDYISFLYLGFLLLLLLFLPFLTFSVPSLLPSFASLPEPDNGQTHIQPISRCLRHLY